MRHLAPRQKSQMFALRRYGVCLLVLILGWSVSANAQGDDPLVTSPDVFIVFDSSNSMKNCANEDCTRTRFTAAIEVLTGNFQDQDGTYTRPTGSCPAQDPDGILDLYKDYVRFGFSSFDDKDIGEGGYFNSDGNEINGCTRYANNENNYGDDPKPNGRRKGRGIKGRRSGNTNMDRCDRGWGCLIDVVDKDVPDDLAKNNANLQTEVCGMAYLDACTPLAASLHDVRYYFENYEDEISYRDPMGPNGGDCRPRYVLLMTDGLEFPRCKKCPESSTGEFCPEKHTGNKVTKCSWYGNEAMQAETLWKMGYPVFVVAYGNMDAGRRQRMHRIARAGMGMPRSKWFVSNDIDVPPDDENNDGPEDGGQPVEENSPLDRLESGETDEPKAFIVDDPAALKLALSMILDSILAGTTSRTDAATTPSSMTFGKAFEYSAWFQMGLSGITWQGYLARDELFDKNGDGFAEEVKERYVAAWDQYELQANEKLTKLPAPDTRRFLTIVEDPRSSTFWNAATGTYTLPRYENNGTKGLYPFKATSSTDSSWDFDLNTMCLSNAESNTYSDAQLARVIKAYTRGESGTKNVTGLRKAEGSQLGDIFHSSPVLVGPPSALTSDYKYEVYFQEYKKRHSMVYVGANDGLLHAFVAEDNDPADGQTPPLTELWGFMPTRVLSKIQEIRHGGHNYFVDATPVAKEVYFHNMDSPDGDPTTDECLQDANNKCIKGAWRTVLIGGLRAGGDAYYALDVTDPDKPGYLWEYRTTLPPNQDPLAGANQCSMSAFQSRATPLVGQVWLKTEDENYINKSVAIVPGGYFPGLELSNMSSCVQLLELVAAGSSLHILDVETGQLMRKFGFSSSAYVGTGNNQESVQDILDDYYKKLAADPDQNWNHWGGGKNWESSDFDETAGTGWQCGEKRKSIEGEPKIPPDFFDDSNCIIEVNPTNKIAYSRVCCKNSLDNGVGGGSGGGNGNGNNNNNGNGNNGNNGNGNNDNNNGNGNANGNNNGNGGGNCFGNTPCAYRVTKYTNGNTQIEIKTEGCDLVNKKDRGRLNLLMGSKFTVESVAATPVGYDMTNDNFISRVFVVASNGKVHRVDMKNALYDPEAPEGQQIKAYASGSTTLDWNTSLWFDPTDSKFMDPPQPTERPVTVSPALALNAERNLTLYYGTGTVDNLNYSDNSSDYFYAVKEVRDPDNPALISKEGELVDVKKDFAPSERLFGKPLIVAGNVYFSTFTPSSNACSLGQSRVYGYKYDDFDPNEAPMQVYVHPDPGIISSPVMRWSSTGPQVVVQQGEKIIKLPDVPKLETKAFVMHWGQVL